MTVSVPKKSKAKKQITVAELKRAIKASGMSSIKTAKLNGCTKIGDYLAQIGPASYGRACLVSVTEHLRLAMEECERLRTVRSDDTDFRARLLDTKEHLAGKLIDGASAILKSAAMDAQHGVTDPRENRSFLPGQAVFPVMAKEMHVTVGAEVPAPTNET